MSKTMGYWKGEILPHEDFVPNFEAAFDVFQFYRNSSLQLCIKGWTHDAEKMEGRGKWDSSLSEHSFRNENEGSERATISTKSFRRLTAKSEYDDSGKPSVFKFNATVDDLIWTVIDKEVETQSVTEWVVNMNFCGRIGSHTTHDEETLTSIRRSRGPEFHWSQECTTNEMPLTSSMRSDCVSINVNVKNNSYLITFGHNNGDHHPGFIDYSGNPSAEECEIIRIAISYAFGCELFALGTTYFDEIGNPIKCEYTSVSFSDLNVATSQDPKPLRRTTQMPHTQLSGVVDAESIERVVQAIIDNDSTIDFKSFSQFYFLARRSPFHIRPLLYGSSLEYLRIKILPDMEKYTLKKITTKKT